MPSKLLLRSSTLPYHVTIRCNNREAFHLPLGVVWEIMNDSFAMISISYGVEVNAFVLMPNHFHLLITTPKSDLGQAMRFFISDVTREINRRAGRSGRVFGGRYHWSLVQTDRYLGNVFRYVYQNPVRACLASKAEDYAYSTLGLVLGTSSREHGVMLRLGFPVFPPRVEALVGEGDYVSHLENRLTWFNHRLSFSQIDLIKNGLRRACFGPKATSAIQKASEIEKLSSTAMTQRNRE